MLFFALGMVVVLAVIGVACFVMATNRLPFTSVSHGCLYCRRRFPSVAEVLTHEVEEHGS